MKISSVTPRDKGMAKWKINNPSLLIFTLKVSLFETKSKTQRNLTKKIRRCIFSVPHCIPLKQQYKF